MERIVGEIPGEMGAQTRTVVRATDRPTSTAWRWSPTSTQQFGLHIDEDTYTTIGGYVLGRLGRRARVGDTIDVEGRRMRVDALDGLRVAKVWLSKPKSQPAADAETADAPSRRVDVRLVRPQQPQRVRDDDAPTRRCRRATAIHSVATPATAGDDERAPSARARSPGSP